MTDQKQILEDGDYNAVVNGYADVYENANGVLTARFEVLIGDMVARNAFCSLTKKNGDVNDFIVKRLAKIYPNWNGDPSWFLEAENTNGAAVIATVVNEGQWSNVKEIRSPTDDGGFEKREFRSMEKKALTTKYAGKFKALIGKKEAPAISQETKGGDVPF